MNLWLISQEVNTGYDTYNAAVVAAWTAEEARKISPSGWGLDCGWAPAPEYVLVKFLGEADDAIAAGMILASFNAG